MIFSEPVSAQQRLHLDLDDSHVHMHVGGAFVFDPGPLAQGDGIDFDRILDFVESRLYRAPRFRQRIARTPLEGSPVWIDDSSFNIRYHVRHTHLPHPGDERQMKRLCGQIASQRLDRERPLWELHIVEGLAGGRFAIVAKVHQCMTSGLWGIGLIEALLSESAEREFESGPIWLPRPAPGREDLIRAALRRRVLAPVQFARTLYDAAANAEELAEDIGRSIAGLRDPDPVSPTPLNAPVGPHRRVDWVALDAKLAHRIAVDQRTSLEAVMLSTVAGALGRFFSRRGITPPDQRDWNFRAASPEQAGGLCADVEGDALSWIVTRLPIAETDPIARLALTTDAIADATRVSYRLFASAIEWLWPGLASAPARRQLGRGASNLIVTKLAGPPARRFLLGAELLEAYPLLPLVPEQAVRISVFDYAGGLYWSVNSDWDLLPDLHDLMDATTECFRELCNAAAERAA